MAEVAVIISTHPVWQLPVGERDVSPKDFFVAKREVPGPGTEYVRDCHRFCDGVQTRDNRNCVPVSE